MSDAITADQPSVPGGPSPAQRLLGALKSPGILAGLVVCFAVIPLGFVIVNSAGLSTSQWAGLWSNRLPELLGNTLSLALLVALFSFLFGVSSAWLVVRRKFFGRRLASWLMVLPLTIPTYVFAHIYTVMLEDDGWLAQAWVGIFGNAVAVPDIYNVAGATFVLSLAGFSYIFLLVRIALQTGSVGMEEAGRIHGFSARVVFWRINLPLLRPAIAAGLAVVVLHVLSDFGAVSMLRFQTFTLSIYLQMSGRFDYQGAAGLSLVLVLLSLSFLILERFFRRKQRYYDLGMPSRPAEARPASPLEQILIWCWIGIIATLGFILPMAWIITWSWDAWQMGQIDVEFWGYVINSVGVAISVAVITVVLALPIAFYHVRRPSLLSETSLQLSSVGFVLPGPVIALGILVFALAVFPSWYGGFTVLIMALVIRFLPLAVQAEDAALQLVTPSVEQAGRIFGAGPLENLRRVVLPMIRGGLAGAWVLVFIDAMKELPATLILRPTGFDTLPVRIWIEASEEMLELAAPSALMLVLATLPALWIMLRSSQPRHQ
ncbi:MAG: iron ABC transporter permease [Gammaproteobacteria bacterium]|nr:MAG: iron ABC transporter permease [Gammaproteobacteria bacterium]